jgi:hypothetical protein
MHSIHLQFTFNDFVVYIYTRRTTELFLKLNAMEMDRAQITLAKIYKMFSLLCFMVS